MAAERVSVFPRLIRNNPFFRFLAYPFRTFSEYSERRQTISNRVTLKIIVALTGAAILAVGGGTLLSFSILDNAFSRSVERSTASLSAFISAQMYYADIASTDITLNLLSREDVFARLELYDRYGSAISEVGRPASDKFIYRELDLAGDDQIKVGELHIWYDAEGYYANLKLTMIASLSLLILFILIFGGLLIKRALDEEVLSPIERLRQQFLSDDLRRSATECQEYQSIEFRDLAQSFISLTKNLISLATTDELTKLYNRRQILEMFSAELKEAKKHSRGVRVFYMDLDNFKHINDYLGHSTGDELLRQVAKRLSSVTSKDFYIARLGGDEFLIVQCYARDDNFGEFVGPVFESFNKPFFIEEKEISISCSMGSATYPKDGVTVEELLKNSDLALYQAKAEGRRRFVEFDESQLKENTTWIEHSTAVKTALENNEAIFHFQPIIDIQFAKATKQKIWGAEALLRIPIEGGGYVDSRRAISLASELGFLEHLTYLTIDSAVNFLLTENSPKHVSINLSREQILKIEVSDYIEKSLLDNGLPLSSLMVEITEEGLLDDSAIQQAIVRLSAIGIRIALDDFGRGHSALSSIRDLPIDVIKLDGSLLNSTESRDREVKLFEAIVSIAQQFNCLVIAEGVETISDRMVVEKCGCNFAQGYYFGKPQAIEGFISGRVEMAASITSQTEDLQTDDEKPTLYIVKSGEVAVN